MYKHVFNIIVLISFITQVKSEQICEHRSCECIDNNISIAVKCVFVEDGDIEGIVNFTLPKRIKSLDLSSNNLTSDGPTYSNYLEILLLNNNSISELLPGSFLHIPQIKTLDLSNNLLENLHSDLFKNISKLENLYLANNKLKTFNFKYLVNLQTINLDNNNIGPQIDSLFTKNGLTNNIQNISISGINLTNIEKNFLEPVRNTLKVLIISNNNLTKFFKLPLSLEYLDMSHNPIKKIKSTEFPVFDTPLASTYCTYRHLKVLKLNNLEISEIPDNTFASLKLRHLELGNNKHLSKFSNLTFGGYVFKDYDFSMTYLTLRGSNLSYIDKGLSALFKNIERLDLRENAWHCDCQLSWVRNLSIADNLRDELRCAYPHHLQNARIFELDPEEFVCPIISVLAIVLIAVVCSLIVIVLLLWFSVPEIRPVFKHGLPGLS